jgi:fucose permease
MLYSNLLLFHSLIRYFVLIFLVIVVVRSYMGWSKKTGFTSMDDKSGLWLLMLTHTQFILGLILYFVSPFVKFEGSTMKDSMLRYWTVEHVSMMLIAVVLITVGRVTSRKMKEENAKHKRMFIFCAIALVIILAAIGTSGRGFFSLGHE